MNEIKTKNYYLKKVQLIENKADELMKKAGNLDENSTDGLIALCDLSSESAQLARKSGKLMQKGIAAPGDWYPEPFRFPTCYDKLVGERTNLMPIVKLTNAKPIAARGLEYSNTKAVAVATLFLMFAALMAMFRAS